MISALIRNTEHLSQVEAVYSTAIDSMSENGRGYVQVVTEYTDDESFEQRRSAVWGPCCVAWRGLPVRSFGQTTVVSGSRTLGTSTQARSGIRSGMTTTTSITAPLISLAMLKVYWDTRRKELHRQLRADGCGVHFARPSTTWFRFPPSSRMFGPCSDCGSRSITCESF